MDGKPMNEEAARKIVLVRAIENADAGHQVLTDDDRLYASRSAHELAQWEASDRQTTLTPALFLQKRAEQILRKLTERMPAFAAVAEPGRALRAVGLGLPLLAFLAGAVVDRITDPHRVDLLSAPLLLIIAWNLAVYALLVVWLVVPRSRPGGTGGGFFRRLASPPRIKPRKLPQALASALARFSLEWTALRAPLTEASVGRVIHLSAALFAAGAITSLYVRGLLSQYQAGWESTFLDAAQVHAALSALFAPAMLVFQLPGFSIDEVRALQGASMPSQARGALWVHLYAATLLLLVILPRLTLALASRWQEQRLRRDFPLDLNEPYFQRLVATLGPVTPAVLRVLPYSFTVDERRDAGLTAVARELLGEQARVMLRPGTPYGESYGGEGQTPSRAGPAADTSVTQTALLFNLSATPERENHGAFIDQVLRQGAGDVAVFVDESAYRERVGGEGTGAARVRERIALWRQFCELHKVPVRVVNLLHPQSQPNTAPISPASTRAP
jgi:hypothetical protein